MAAPEASNKTSLADAVERAKSLAKEAGVTAGEFRPAEPPVKLQGMCGWKIDDNVMIHGLQSAAGQKLNGRYGVIVEFVEATNRFKVELGPGEVHAVKPDNLRYTDKAPTWRRGSPDSGSSSSDSSERKAREKRIKKRRKERAGAFSSFTSFNQEGAAYEGKSREEMTAEEQLHEMINGPMSKTERDNYFRQREAEQKRKEAAEKEQKQKVPPTPAAGALKVGDPVIVHGLQSESGQKLNGRSGVIGAFIESSGRFQVQLGPGEAPALKRENLKYNSSVPEWMRD